MSKRVRVAVASTYPKRHMVTSSTYKWVSRDIVLHSETKIDPGARRVIRFAPMELFRAERALVIESVQYAAFVIEKAQLRSTRLGIKDMIQRERPATDFLLRLRVEADRTPDDVLPVDRHGGLPFLTAQSDETISMTVRSIADVPLLFAVGLRGSRYNER